MYISKVVIKNFRNFKEFEIELKAFTIIIGENNIGKSNLLEAISLVLSNDILAYKKRRLEIEDINFDAISEFKRNIIEKEIDDIVFPEVRIDLYVKEPNWDQETVIDNWWYDFESKIARFSYLFSYRSKRRKQFLLKQKENINGKNETEAIEYIDFPIDSYEFELIGGVSDSKVDGYYLKMLKMDYLDALRDAKRELNSNSDKKLLYRILSDRKEEQFEEIKSLIIELDKAVKSDKNVLEILRKDIGDYLDKISLETETSNNNVDFMFSSIELSEVLKKIGLQYGGDAISIDRNGLGRNNLLYIAVVMAHLYEKENEYFRLVALEEPEAHINPILQRHLSINIKGEEDDKQQIIITTHSTHIASYLDLQNTVVLFKDGKEIKNHYLLSGFNEKRAADKRTIRYLQKWLNATNSTMFFSRKVIFVEGIAEEILIPIFYQWKYGTSLDKINCQVVNINGVSFSHFLDIVKNGYFVKSAVLTDSDCKKKTEARANELKKKYNSDIIGVFVTEKTDTFEKELFETNKSKKANRLYLADILGKVRPNKCNDAFKEKCNNGFDIDELFECVEEYKSEFAFELAEEMEKTLKKSSVKKAIVIPKYILDAFKFISGE